MLIFLFFENCYSQNTIVKDISNNEEMNYIFSRIITKSAYTKSLYNDGLFISIYELSDSKATPSDLYGRFFK